MKSLRAPFMRHTIGNAAPGLRNVQKRWAQVHDVRFLVTRQGGEGVAEKYKEKLQQKAKAEGFKSVHELKASYQEKIAAQGMKTAKPKPTSAGASSSSPSQISQADSPYPPPPPPPQAASSASAPSPSFKSSTAPGVKTLSSFIDVDKTSALPHREIEVLWRLRHAKDPQSLCAVIPSATYNRIEATARKHPRFILPLPRVGKGAEIHFLQWTFPSPTTATVLFTHLAEFKLRGEYAQPHTTVTHHLGMREEKGLVLLHGNVIQDRGVSVDEGKWLLMCLQKFYGGEGEQDEKRRLLEHFSRGNEEFNIEQLLEEAEKIS